MEQEYTEEKLWNYFFKQYDKVKMATEPVFGKSYTLSGGKLDSGEIVNITFTWNGYKYNFIPFTDHYTYNEVTKKCFRHSWEPGNYKY